MSNYNQTIWNYFCERIGNEYGVAGLMGNLEAESALNPTNVQNGFGWSDEDYTTQVDNGTYTESQFVNDSIGYGLAQWTYYTRKQRLYNMYKSGSYTSIGSIELALDYLWWELQYSFAGVLSVLKNATSVREASDSVLHDFESPKDQSASVEEYRESLGIAHYETLKGTYNPQLSINAKIIEDAIAWALNIANDDTHGYDQNNRWSPDYDCSSFLITAFENAGCLVKTAGATFTGDMEENFVECGFEVILFNENTELKRGDVLWRSGHTEMYIGDGKNVGAHINEFGETTDGETGDQTGHEISVTNFADSGSWTKIFRLPSWGSSGGGTGGTTTHKKKKKRNYKFVLFSRRKAGIRF